jgi:hypothetical protein
MNIYSHSVGVDPFHIHEVVLALAAFGATGMAFLWWGFKEKVKLAAAWVKKLFTSRSRSYRNRK